MDKTIVYFSRSYCIESDSSETDVVKIAAGILDEDINNRRIRADDFLVDTTVADGDEEPDN